MSSKQKKKRIKAVHQKLRVFQAKEPLLSVIAWGINYSIVELSLVSTPVMLMPDDFKAYSKVKIDNHLFNKENMPSHFKFKEWCPLVFKNLRERFGVDDKTYMNSLTKSCPLDLDSPGKSGARFLMSGDQKFVIKTINNEDASELFRILEDYHQYVVERHGCTRLPHYLGFYKVTVNDSETCFVVMKNILGTGYTIHRKYDLKGSTVDRQASCKEKSKELPTLKDNDFINDRVYIHVGQENRIKLASILESDSLFLANLNLMDYSLFVGIHELDHPTNLESDDNDDTVFEEFGNGKSCCPEKPILTPVESPSSISNDEQGYETDGVKKELGDFAVNSSGRCCQPVIYFVALVDILTRYGVKKRTAQAAKSVKHGVGAEISTVKPEQYARRFIEFVEKFIVE